MARKKNSHYHKYYAMKLQTLESYLTALKEYWEDTENELASGLRLAYQDILGRYGYKLENILSKKFIQSEIDELKKKLS